MGMPDTARRYTVDEVLSLPADGNRYELVDGELLVTPAPNVRHQVVIGRLYRALADYLDRHPDAAVLLSPADIRWDREQLVQPDLFVVPVTEMSRTWTTVHTLLLAAEIVSPSSARGDRLVKRRLYQRHGVATYWIVDHDAALVEVWQPADERPEIVTDVLHWRAAPDAEDLAFSVASLFEGLPT